MSSALKLSLAAVVMLGFAIVSELSVQAASSEQALSPVTRPILDFSGWHTSEPENELLYQLSVAPMPNRQTARWALARYYIGQDNVPDALGVLGAMAGAEPKMELSVSYRALRGYAQLRMGHIADAANDLEQIPLDGEAQIWLLRVQLREAQGKDADAVIAYQRGVAAIRSMTAADRTSIQFSALRSAISTRHLTLASRIISTLPKAGLTASQAAEVDLLQGKMATLSNRDDVAAYYFNKAEMSASRKISTDAKISVIRQALRKHQLTPSQAIDRLDRLRFAWRGDRIEFGLLTTLSDLYVQTKQWRQALATMREAVTYFPISDQTRALNAQMQTLFVTLFSNGTAARMQPLEALSLFSDFRDLVPLGDEGDRMIRQLADRLIDVGLPDRAAGLLEYQVRYRLMGTPQAVVAVRAGLVELMANQPKQAVALLRLTKQNDMPDDVRQMRDLVEARALIQLGRVASALDLIEDDAGRFADLLRIDGYWRTKDWKGLRIAAAALYADPVSRLQVMDQRQVLRWAFALAMDGSAVERDILRRRFGVMMARTSYGEAFALLTSARQIGTAETKRLAVVLADIDQLQDLSGLYSATSVVPPQRVAAPKSVKLAAN